MNGIVEVKYAVEKILLNTRQQKKATVASSGYDLFAAEDKTLFPRCVTPVTIEIEMEISSGYFAETYPRSSFVRK